MATPITMIPMTMSRRMPPPLTDDGTNWVLVVSSPIVTSTICTIPPASAFMTPELAAIATVRPCFWKNRMTSAVVAIVPPMRPVKLLANCSASTGPNGSGRLTAPMSATEPENCGTKEIAKATTTQVQSASASVARRSTPANWATIR